MRGNYTICIECALKIVKNIKLNGGKLLFWRHQGQTDAKNIY